MDLRAYIRDVPDFPKPGILFKDIMPLLAAPPAFAFAVDARCAPDISVGVDAIAAAESAGVFVRRADGRFR